MELEERKTVELVVYRITADELKSNKYILLQAMLREQAEDMFTEDGLAPIFWEDHYCPDASITFSVTEEDIIDFILAEQGKDTSNVTIERHNKEDAFGETLDYVLVTCYEREPNDDCRK